jgi:hypothetical protein
MLEYLPSDVVQDFGQVYETVFNGKFVDFPADRTDEIVAALEREGYRCATD